MNLLKRFSGKCAAMLIAFGCSALVLYKLAEQHMNIPAPQEFRIDQVGWQCQEEHTILKTSGSELCLGTHNIFFIETAASTSLNPRQACAIESAARYHPTHDILTLMTPKDAIDLNNGVIKLLNSIDNVKIVKVDIPTLVYGTPYYEWYASNIWQKSKYKITHMSDGLRFFLLWNYGGMYLDMDVVVLRPLSSLRNTVVSDNGVNAGSSVMFFDRHHDIVGRFMSDFVTHYDPDNFASNGPTLINRNIKKFCHTEGIVDVRKKSGCAVDVLPQDRAYPIPFQRWGDYFVSSNVTSLSERFNNSYLIHAWNYLSSKKPIVMGSNCLYEVAMKEHCPLVYEYSQQFPKV